MTIGASLRFDHSFLAVEQEQRIHCMLDLNAPALPKERQRLPLHLALVIDRSGSMRGEKLQTAKQAAVFLAHRLRSDDQLSIIAYDNEVALVHGLAPVGDDHRLVENAIWSLPSGGQTNLSGGWLKGAEQLRGVPGGSGPRKVLLLSDGLANVGVTDGKKLAKLARVAAKDGIGTTTIGFGDGFDEELMTAMADEGGGNAHFAPGVDDVPGIFNQEFNDLVALVAQNLSVEIRPNSEVSVVSVLNEFPATAVPDGIQVQIGDAYADEHRRVIFALDVPRLASLGPATVADLIVRYVAVGEEVAAHELKVPVTVNLVSADDPAAAELDTEVEEEIVILMTARAKEEARKRAIDGDITGAQDLLAEAAENLRKISKKSKRAAELLTEAERTDGYGSAMSLGSFDARMRKSMHYEIQGARKHRRKDTE